MIAHRRSSVVLLVITFLILLSSSALLAGRSGIYMTDSGQEQKFNQVADVSPSIYDWGYEGRPNESEAFTVWANVTDDDSDLANVSIHVSGPNTTINELMAFNGTFYVADLEAFQDVGTYNMYVSATDLALHTITGRHIYVVISIPTTELPDPYLTMPFVVISSLIAGLIVCYVAYYYGSRRPETAT